MTYCVATMIDAGIVFASDSRTNAGVDNISTFRKMRTFERQGERALVVVNSGWRVFRGHSRRSLGN